MSRHIFASAGAKELGIVRATVFGVWFIVIAFSPITSYAYLPACLFEPLGLFRLFLQQESAFTKAILNEQFLFFMKIALLAGCFFCMIGVKGYRWVVIPTVFLLFLADGITKGFNGFVNHAELGILYSSLILAIFPAGDGFSLFKTGSVHQKPDAYYSVPILAIAITLCLAYTFVGVHRLLYGGMEQFTNHAMEIHLLRNSLEYSKWGFDLGLYVASSKPLLILFKAGFFAVTLFEAFSLYALINRTFLCIWLAVMVPFHLLSLFTMNIFFWENLILILVLFLVIGRNGLRQGLNS